MENITLNSTEQKLQEKYKFCTLSFWSGGVEYFGEVEKVFYNPTVQEFQAKCKMYNETERYFYKTLDRNA